jgi:serine/threonine-protein kinase HipA
LRLHLRSHYLEREQPAAIAHTLPLRVEPYVSERGLHPFFDNLVAEGWFRNVQARALGIDPGSRFALLLGFGHDWSRGFG